MLRRHMHRRLRIPSSFTFSNSTRRPPPLTAVERHFSPLKRSSKREQTYTAFCCPLSTGVKPEIAIFYPSIFLIDKKQLIFMYG